MKMLNKSLLAIGALAFSTFSHAVPVTTWSATTVGIWDAASVLPAVGGGNAPAVTGGNKVLSWGIPSGTSRSSLTINDSGPVNVDTYFCAAANCPVPKINPYVAPSINVVHANNVITGPSMTDAALDLSVTLTPTVPVPGGPQALAPVKYSIKFKETPNTSGTCVTGSVSTCDDIFVLVGGLLNEQFNYLGDAYYLNAFPSSGTVLNVLTNEQCAAANVANGCFGFLTEERESNIFNFSFTVSNERLTNDVPEPGSLALMGLALAGMGVVSRRRSAKQPKA